MSHNGYVTKIIQIYHFTLSQPGGLKTQEKLKNTLLMPGLLFTQDGMMD